MQVAGIIARLTEAHGFALAGGAALILRGEVDRTTRDLDFFGLAPLAVDELVPAVDRALRAAGLSVRHIQSSPGFARLRREEFEIDDASYRQLAALVEQWRARAIEVARREDA
jgi:hypothetical protein